jgi:(p)ppGpp synthase/HD superfamily hydrolase
MNILLEEQAFDSTITDDVIIAGLLHDLNEDAGISIKTIKELYGDTVAKIVLDVSEPEDLKQDPDKGGTWKKRKEHSIEVMKTADRFSKLVFCADKLANSRSINNNLLLGEDIFAQFNTGKEEIFWYYNSVLEVLGIDQSIKNTRMYKLLNQTVQEIVELSKKEVLK